MTLSWKFKTADLNFRNKTVKIAVFKIKKVPKAKKTSIENLPH